MMKLSTIKEPPCQSKILFLTCSDWELSASVETTTPRCGSLSSLKCDEWTGVRFLLTCVERDITIRKHRCTPHLRDLIREVPPKLNKVLPSCLGMVSCLLDLEWNLIQLRRDYGRYWDDMCARLGNLELPLNGKCAWHRRLICDERMEDERRLLKVSLLISVEETTTFNWEAVLGSLKDWKCREIFSATRKLRWQTDESKGPQNNGLRTYW